MVIRTVVIPSMGINPLDLVDSLLELSSQPEELRPKAYQLELDVSIYKPESVVVKIADKKLTVSGDREEKRENGATFEDHFKYNYPLAEDADVEKMEHVITKNGRLMVRIPVKIPEPRKVAIERTEKTFHPQMEKKQEKPETVEKKQEKPETVEKKQEKPVKMEKKQEKPVKMEKKQEKPENERKMEEHQEFRRVPIQLAY